MDTLRASARPFRFFYSALAISAILLTSFLMARDHNRFEQDPNVDEELASFKIADGFEVSLFAAEPMVVKPIQMNWDADGRLWVVSSTVYPHLKTGEEANDKIYVLEDTDGDGKADKSTIFAEGLLTPTGILPGDGGVYVANSTELLFLSDTDGDGKADKKHKILGGFGTADTHHLIHTFRWGPEGYLYFNQSIYIYSHVETPSGIKRLEGGGVWQFNPKTLELNIYAKGLVNPWGLRFDRWGQSFLTDGAGGEGINYAFPGATFLTSPGAERIIRGLNPGQPKHCGLEIVSGRHLPESWKGSVLANDFRANRVNRFMLEEQGSGYASKQMEDLLWTDHVAFRPVDVNLGPDGAIYIADWYNPIIQHGEVDFHDPRRDQQHGRIWKIVAKNRPLLKTPKLSKAPVKDLLDLLKVPEEWTRSQAKQVLKERGAEAVIPVLDAWVVQLDKADQDYEHQLLEALWVYQALNVVKEPLLGRLLEARSHNARAAALRALQHWYKKITNVPAILTKAVQDDHPQVRLEAVIALRKLQSAEAARTALEVVEKPMDEFLDYALWQTMRELEPAWVQRLKGEPEFFGNSKKTTYALKSVNNPEAVTQLMKMYRNKQVPDAYQKDVLASFAKSASSADLNLLLDMVIAGYAKGDKNVPEQLATLELAAQKRNIRPDQNLGRIESLMDSDDDAVSTRAIRLSGLWQMGGMTDKLAGLILKEDRSVQKAGLAALAYMKSPAATDLLFAMTGDKYPTELRVLATAQVVSVDLAKAASSAAALLARAPEQTDVTELFQSFFSIRQGTKALADALINTKIPVAHAKAGRQIVQRQLSFNRQNDDDVKLVKQALEASGGVLPAEKMPQQLSDKNITLLAKDVNSTSNPQRGEMIFRRAELNCQTCHSIGGAGGRIGPDLSSLGTSSPVETIIRSILYPTHSIKEGYELQRIVKKDGSEILGYLVSNGLSEVVMRDVTGLELAIPKSQINDMEKVPGSLMPPGLTAGLDKQEFVDLIGFLSKIGESGDFRVPNVRYVRRWEVASDNKNLVKKVKDEGIGYVVKGNAKVPFIPGYAKVTGGLPLIELPVLEQNANRKFSVVRFEIEVLSKGNIKLAFDSNAGITAWNGSKALKFTNNALVAEFSPGIQQVTLAIDRALYKEKDLRVQLLDAEQDAAQTRLIMGR